MNLTKDFIDHFPIIDKILQLESLTDRCNPRLLNTDYDRYGCKSCEGSDFGWGTKFTEKINKLLPRFLIR